jgi:hypothetical protein
MSNQIYVFSGASQTGKTTKAKQLIASLKCDAVFCWDVEAQWCELAGYKKVTSMLEIKQICKDGKKGKYAFVYSGADMKKAYEELCACVFHFIQFYGDKYKTCFVGEEQADVTSASKAAPRLGMLIRRGLKRNLSIIAISQRWQEADKTSLGNCHEVFIFAPPNTDDAKYLGKKFSIDVADIMKLKPFEYIHWVKFNGYSVKKLSKR